jgi:hypothetical protein
MITFDIQPIFGAMLGIELADRETLDALDLTWAFNIDLLFIRLVVMNFKEDF